MRANRNRPPTDERGMGSISRLRAAVGAVVMTLAARRGKGEQTNGKHTGRPLEAGETRAGRFRSFATMRVHADAYRSCSTRGDLSSCVRVSVRVRTAQTDEPRMVSSLLRIPSIKRAWPRGPMSSVLCWRWAGGVEISHSEFTGLGEDIRGRLRKRENHEVARTYSNISLRRRLSLA